MENSEQILQSLLKYAKLGPQDATVNIPDVETYLSYVAKTGDLVFDWSAVKCFYRRRMLDVITEFHEDSRNADLPQWRSNDSYAHETKDSNLLKMLDSFPRPPFTLQRFCELLLAPRKGYNRADKFVFALEKILMVGTYEPRHNPLTRDVSQPDSTVADVNRGQMVTESEIVSGTSSVLQDAGNEIVATGKFSVKDSPEAPVDKRTMEESGGSEMNMEVDLDTQTAHEGISSNITVKSFAMSTEAVPVDTSVNPFMENTKVSDTDSSTEHLKAAIELGSGTEMTQSEESSKYKGLNEGELVAKESESHVDHEIKDTSICDKQDKKLSDNFIVTAAGEKKHIISEAEAVVCELLEFIFDQVTRAGSLRANL